MKINIYITTHDLLAASRGAAILGLSVPAAILTADCRSTTQAPQLTAAEPRKVPAAQASGIQSHQPYMPTTSETPNFD